MDDMEENPSRSTVDHNIDLLHGLVPKRNKTDVAMVQDEMVANSYEFVRRELDNLTAWSRRRRAGGFVPLIDGEEKDFAG